MTGVYAKILCSLEERRYAAVTVRKFVRKRTQMHNADQFAIPSHVASSSKSYERVAQE